MPLYEYECPEHGRFTTGAGPFGRVLCPLGDIDDHHWAKRKWGFAIGNIMPSHFNPFVGKEVHGPNTLDEAFKRASDEATESKYQRDVAARQELLRAAEHLADEGHDYSGFDVKEPERVEHRFRRVDTRDTEALGVTEHGLDETRKRDRDALG